jgi:hypothetical protein
MKDYTLQYHGKQYTPEITDGLIHIALIPLSYNAADCNSDRSTMRQLL